MRIASLPFRGSILPMVLGLSLFAGSPALADNLVPGELPAPLLDAEALGRALPTDMPTDPGSGALALSALGQGRWSVACSMATRVLARQVPDVEALGLFTLCAAVQDDRQTAVVALKRLKQVEPVRHYSVLTEAVLRLQEGAPDVALATLGPVLQARAGDPLARYFHGEALHALKRDAEAITEFKAVTQTWPDHVPALTAAARLVLALPDAAAGDLESAITMAERAARLEPWQRKHWRVLADLCRRAGQEARATAITLQWLDAPASARGPAPAQ